MARDVLSQLCSLALRRRAGEGGPLMDPIEELMREHRRIEQELTLLELWAQSVSDPRFDGRGELAVFLKFFREYVDEYHHEKEERVLSDALLELGLSRPSGPVFVMLHEGGQGSRERATLQQLALSDQPWSSGQRLYLIQTIVAFSKILRDHVKREDQILYPLARRFLDESTFERMRHGLDRRAQGAASGLGDALG